MRCRLCTILARYCWKKSRGESAARLESAEQPLRGNTRVQVSTATSSPVPRSPSEIELSEILPVPTPASPSTPNALPLVQALPEGDVGQARDRCNLPKPYATNSELWIEALGNLREPETQKIIQDQIGDPDPDVKSLAEDIQKKIDTAFKKQQHHDSGTSRVIENAVEVVKKFTSIVDVAVSYDPAHAALPWAAVRFIIEVYLSPGEFNNQLLAGISVVASLLVQCDTYQKLYMAPDIALRPPEPALVKLKESIVQAYTKTQSFLGYAVQHQQSKIGTITAPFKLGNIENHLNELLKCEDQLVRIADDYEKYCNLSSRSSLKQLSSLQASFPKMIKDQIQLVLEQLDDKEQREMLEWISPILYGGHHVRVKDTRTSNTCEWLLRHQNFREWKESSSSTILWLQGSPGAGKTFSTSKVIDHIQAQLEDSPEQQGFAFFYCNRNEAERRTPLSILQSYVRQLSTPAHSRVYIRKRLRELCQEKRRVGSKLSLSDCKEQLLESVNLYTRTTIVLDALDECEADSRIEILKIIESLCTSERLVKVFISSRPDRDIRNRFAHTPNIEIQATDNEGDIKKFVEEAITKHDNWHAMNPELKSRIITTLFNRSQGMFQWASLQIKQILSLEAETAILDRLGKIPADLKTAYDEIYDQVKARHKNDRFLTDNAFKWVAVACKPLNSEELLSMIRIDAQQDTFHLFDKISESQLLHLCNNLLVLDSKLKVWRFPHLSVVEYFESNHWTLPKAHAHCASVCLKALLNIAPRLSVENSCSNSQAIQHDGMLESKHPLKEYVNVYWVTHVEAQEVEETDPVLEHLLKSFLGSPQKSSLKYREWYSELKPKGEYGIEARLIRDLAPETVAFFAMCRFSFWKILLDWWKDPKLDLSQRNKHGRNALEIAARYGRKENCENLVELGVDVNLTRHPDENFESGYSGSALADAVSEGQIEIVKFLIEKAGADVNLSLPGTFGSALIQAASTHHINIVEFLVKNAGASINQQTQAGKYGSALVAAAFRGHIKQVQFLVQAGGDINLQPQTGYFGSALAAAAAKVLLSDGDIDIIQFLVQAGADINLQLQTGDYGSALAIAAFHGNIKTVQFLVQAGGDINLQLQTGCFGSALAAAAAKVLSSDGNIDIIQFLVQAGADINLQLQTGDYGSALAAAAFNGNIKAVQFLVQAGADINLQLQTGCFGSALAAAAAAVLVLDGNIDTVQFLVQAGADINLQLQTGDYGSALAAAASNPRNFKAVQFLIQSGADIHLQLQVNRYGSALATAAASHERIESLQLLVQAGADVNAQLQVGYYGSALAAAVVMGATENVEFLVLTAKANVNQQIRRGMFGGSALAAAAFWGEKDCADILLKAGAEVNLKIDHGPFRTALQASRANISVEALRRGGYWGNAERFKQNQTKVEELLRLHGATEEE